MARNSDFFDFVKELDDNKIKYDKTTFSFDVEKGVVIENSYILKLIDDSFIYGTISSTKETSDANVVKKWLDVIINRYKPIEKKQPKIALKDFIGEAKNIERIRRRIEKEFPRYVIKENNYPCRIKSLDGKNSLIVDYKNKVYSITVIDKNGFVMGRPYRCTNFETLLDSVYNHVYLSNLED
jgi:hypothetical protein